MQHTIAKKAFLQNITYTIVYLLKSTNLSCFMILGVSFTHDCSYLELRKHFKLCAFNISPHRKGHLESNFTNISQQTHILHMYLEPSFDLIDVNSFWVCSQSTILFYFSLFPSRIRIRRHICLSLN